MLYTVIQCRCIVYVSRHRHRVPDIFFLQDQHTQSFSKMQTATSMFLVVLLALMSCALAQGEFSTISTVFKWFMCISVSKGSVEILEFDSGLYITCNLRYITFNP